MTKHHGTCNQNISGLNLWVSYIEISNFNRIEYNKSEQATKSSCYNRFITPLKTAPDNKENRTPQNEATMEEIDGGAHTFCNASKVKRCTFFSFFFLYVCCVQDSKSLNHIVYHKSLDNLTLLLLLYIRRDNKRKEL
jgi:hypothetical protein